EKEFEEARAEDANGLPEWATSDREIVADVVEYVAKIEETDSAAASNAGDQAAYTNGPPPVPGQARWAERPKRKYRPAPDISGAVLPRPPGFFSALSGKAHVFAVLMKRIVSTAASTDRLAYFWLLVEPMIQVMVVVSVYWLLGRTIVMGMPAIPFAITGVSAWLMFRTILLRVGQGLSRDFGVCFFPGVTRLMVLLARAAFLGIVYFIAALVMLFLVNYLDVARTEPQNLFMFTVIWIVIWLQAVGFSFVLAYALTLAPALRKFMPFGVRVLFLLSGVAVITEQLPGSFKPYFLWNPVLHAMQFLRSAWFWQYHTSDASAFYMLSWTVLVLFLGLSCEQLQTRRPLRP
ncbi:MAG TPA: hypothetical protein ENJ99_01770, partial [Rhizobiales bacterium]|nr:hypothetical protein [Hyphomicrobiales bacterium]